MGMTFTLYCYQGGEGYCTVKKVSWTFSLICWYFYLILIVWYKLQLVLQNEYFVYHSWGDTSIYRPLSYPLRSLMVTKIQDKRRTMPCQIGWVKTRITHILKDITMQMDAEIKDGKTWKINQIKLILTAKFMLLYEVVRFLFDWR